MSVTQTAGGRWGHKGPLSQERTGFTCAGSDFTTPPAPAAAAGLPSDTGPDTVSFLNVVVQCGKHNKDERQTCVTMAHVIMVMQCDFLEQVCS